jgi:hypothetical protein
MTSLHRIVLFVFFLGAVTPLASAEEPVLLLGTIVKWQYPGSKIGESEASDAATIDALGNRTIPSTLLKTTMVTDASVEEVVRYYRGLLTRGADQKEKLGVDQHDGISVVFDDDSGGRALAFHTILVNSPRRTTLIAITRLKNETKTYITWKQYVKHTVEP